MSFREDASSSRSWIVGIAVQVMQHALGYNALETELLNKVRVMSECAELPDEDVIRLRCFPNVWNLRA